MACEACQIRSRRRPGRRSTRVPCAQSARIATGYAFAPEKAFAQFRQEKRFRVARHGTAPGRMHKIGGTSTCAELNVKIRDRRSDAAAFSQWSARQAARA